MITLIGTKAVDEYCKRNRKEQNMRKENLNTRDLSYSRRHRNFGEKILQIDIDSVEYSYDTHEPLCIISLKHGNCKHDDPNEYKNVVMRKMADGLGLPFFLVVYKYWNELLGRYVDVKDHPDAVIDKAEYSVLPYNKIAKKKFFTAQQDMSEPEYIEFLERLRQ